MIESRRMLGGGRREIGRGDCVGLVSWWRWSMDGRRTERRVDGKFASIDTNLLCGGCP